MPDALDILEGMAVVRAKGKLRGEKPTLPVSVQRWVVAHCATGQVILADLAEEYAVSRSTIHRIIAGHHGRDGGGAQRLTGDRTGPS